MEPTASYGRPVSHDSTRLRERLPQEAGIGVSHVPKTRTRCRVSLERLPTGLFHLVSRYSG